MFQTTLSHIPSPWQARALAAAPVAAAPRYYRVAMKLILAIFGILSASAAQAQNAPWCLQPQGEGSLHCTYATFQQCLADRTGNGFCIQNSSTYQPPRHPFGGVSSKGYSSQSSSAVSSLGQCPLYPRKRTLLGATPTSAKCQKRTRPTIGRHQANARIFGKYFLKFCSLPRPVF